MVTIFNYNAFGLVASFPLIVLPVWDGHISSLGHLVARVKKFQFCAGLCVLNKWIFHIEHFKYILFLKLLLIKKAMWIWIIWKCVMLYLYGIVIWEQHSEVDVRMRGWGGCWEHGCTEIILAQHSMKCKSKATIWKG